MGHTMIGRFFAAAAHSFVFPSGLQSNLLCKLADIAFSFIFGILLLMFSNFCTRIVVM